jgi:plasmid stability protein
MNVTLKNVPDSVYNGMKREARRNRRSLNAEMICAREGKAAEADRRQRLPALLAKIERFRATLPLLPDSTPMIRRERDHR